MMNSAGAALESNCARLTTVRMTGEFRIFCSLGARRHWTFDRVGPDGDLHAAADIHAMTPANLNREFARIVSDTQDGP